MEKSNDGKTDLFITAFKESVDDSLETNNILVFFTNKEKLTNEDVTDYFKLLSDRKCVHGVLVFGGAMTSSAK